MRRINWKRHLPALLAFMGVVILLHWPLVTHWRTHIFGRPFEDVFEVLWQLRWMDTAVFQLQTNPFYSPNIFHPQGWYLASGAQPAWYTLAMAPFTHLLGATAVYNLTALLSLVLGGFGVYLLAQQHTTDRLAGVLAGCVYITMPILTLRLGGHWHTLLAAMFLPYVVWAIHRTLTSPISRRWIAATAVLWAMMILSSWYFLFIGVLPVLAYVAGLLWRIRSQEQNRCWRSKGTAVLITGLLTLLLISPFIWLTWQANLAMFGERIQFPLLNAANITISPNKLITPPPRHPFWDLIQQSPPPFPGEKDQVFIGFAGGLLALLGLFGRGRRRLPLLLLGSVALILGLGIFLYWQAEPVLVNWPFLGNFYEGLELDIPSEDGRYPIPLPGLLLHRFLPFYDSIRVWARYAIAMMLAVSVLAALGASTLKARGRWGTAVMVILLVVVLWEGNIVPYSNFTAVTVNDRQANEWLAAQPPGTVIYEYPDFVPAVIMYSQSIHQQTIVNGYMSRLPREYAEAVPALGRWPRPSAVPILQEWGVDYIVVNGYQTNDIFNNELWPVIIAIEELCLVADFNDGFMDFDRTAVFALHPPEEPCPPPDS